MADNTNNKIVVPSFFTSSQIQAWVNKNFPDSPILSVDDAVKQYLDTQLGVETIYDSQRNDTPKQLLKHIFSALPPELLKIDVLSNLDLRPLIEASSNIDLKFKVEDTSRDEPRKINKTVNSTEAATLLLDSVTAVYKEQALNYVGTVGTPKNNAQQAVAAEDFLKNTKGLSPAAYANGSYKTLGVIPADDSSTIDSSTTDSGISSEGYDSTGIIATTGLTDYTQYLQSHIGDTVKDLITMEGPSGIDSGMFDTSKMFQATDFITNLTGKVPTGDAKEWDLMEAQSYPYSLQKTNPNGLKKLQQTLRDTGYYAKVNQWPGSDTQVDDATTLAWNAFLTDALRNNRTPSDQMKIQGDDFAKRLAAGEGINFVDPAAVDATIQKFGASLLGRSLNSTEVNTLNQQVRQWQIDANKQQALGKGGDQINLDARISQYIEQTNHEESIMNGLSNTIKNVKQIFG